MPDNKRFFSNLALFCGTPIGYAFLGLFWGGNIGAVIGGVVGIFLAVWMWYSEKPKNKQRHGNPVEIPDEIKNLSAVQIVLNPPSIDELPDVAAEVKRREAAEEERSDAASNADEESAGYMEKLVDTRRGMASDEELWEKHRKNVEAVERAWEIYIEKIDEWLVSYPEGMFVVIQNEKIWIRNNTDILQELIDPEQPYLIAPIERIEDDD